MDRKSMLDLLLASDIDGTLIDESLKIPAYTLNKIEAFKNSGGIFTLATGRSMESARPFVDIVRPNCPVVLLNGSMIYDYATEKIVYEDLLPSSAEDLVRAVMGSCPKIGVEIHKGTNLYILKKNRQLAEHITMENLAYTEAAIDEVPKGWSKLLFTGTAAEIDELRQFINSLNIADIYGVSTFSFYYEVLHKNVNKGSALLTLADMLNVKHENICAIGDYYNDEDMIRMAGVGAFVANAPEEIKPLADYIACTGDKGAVGDFIKYLHKTKTHKEGQG